MNFIKKITLALAVCCTVAPAFAQTLIVNPHTDGGFELGNTFQANGWTVVNTSSSSSGNNWYLSTSALTSGVFSFAPTGNRMAYISQSNNGPWTYNINQYSTTHLYKDVTFPAGQEIIKLKFRWNANGEGPIYDVLYVYSCPTTLTPVVGQPSGTGNSTANWTGTGASQLHATLHSSPVTSGSTTEITLPAAFAGTNRRLVFTWKNGNTLGFQPPAALDSVWLFSDCPKPEIQLVNNTVPCSNNINISANVVTGGTAGTLQWYVNSGLIPGATGTTFTSNTVPSGSTVRCIYSINNVCGYKDTADIVVQYSTNTILTETFEVCSRNLPATWRGVQIPQGATSNSNYTTVTVPKPGGCDSVINLNLLVKQSPAVRTEYLSLCRGQLSQTQWRGKTIPNNAHSSPTFDTAYAPSPNGCDSVIYLSLHIIEAADINTETITSCEPITVGGVRYTSSTTLSDTFRSASGCDSAINVKNIIIEAFDLSASVRYPQGNYVEGTPISIQAQSSDNSFQVLGWYPQSLFGFSTASIQNILAPAEQRIYVVAKSSIGCVDSAFLDLKAMEVDRAFEMPNAFTPNGDGKNDFFAPVFKQALVSGVVQFDIYNRWGQLVYSDYSSSASKGWDGYYNGRIADHGVYMYRITVKFADQSVVTKTGEVHLLR